MRAAISTLVLTLAIATPLAHADTYDFNFAGVDYGSCGSGDCPTFNIDFQLPSTPDSFTSTTATYNSVYVNDPNQLFSSGSYLTTLTDATSTTAEQIAFLDPETAQAYATFYLEDSRYSSFSSGPNSSLTFIPGSYDFAVNSLFYSDSVYGPVTITDLSTPPTTVTPEPSTLALLGTGVLGAAGLLPRRRLPR